MYFYDYDKIISTLQNWGYNKGHFEEIVRILANNDDEYIYSAEARILDDFISYTLELTKKGIEVHAKWCAKYDYTPHLTNGRYLDFTDENKDSIRNTKEDWGLIEN